MQNSRKTVVSSTFELYYKDLSQKGYQKLPYTTSPRSSCQLQKSGHKVSGYPNLPTHSHEKKVHNLKVLSQKIDGVEALLKKKHDGQERKGKDQKDSILSSMEEKKNVSIESSYKNQCTFNGRTTCPNVLQKMMVSPSRPDLRTTSNLSHLTKYGLGCSALKHSKNIPSTHKQEQQTDLNYLQNIKHSSSVKRILIEQQKQPAQKYYEQSKKKQQKMSQMSINDTFDTLTQSIQKPTMLDRFKIVKMLGRGKFGEVFLAQHKETRALYALKKIVKEKVKEMNMINQFLEEIKLHSCLDHPNIVKFFGYFEENYHIYLILQYVTGGTLFDYLNQHEKLAPQQATNYLRDTIEAMNYLHDRSIAHRDLKPENILLNCEGVAKLCDFGWSALVKSARKTYCGTFDYVPPQVLERKQYGLEVDLWCLGILAYELLSGDVPFDGQQRVTKMRKILSVDKQKINYPKHFTPEAITLIESLVRKDPNQRLKTRQLLQHEFFVVNPPIHIKKK